MAEDEFDIYKDFEPEKETSVKVYEGSEAVWPAIQASKARLRCYGYQDTSGAEP